MKSLRKKPPSAGRNATRVIPTMPRESEEVIGLRQEQEALLLATITKILDWIGADDEDSPYVGEELAEHRSLEWLATEIYLKLDSRYESKIKSGDEPYRRAFRDFCDRKDELELCFRRGTRGWRAFYSFHKEIFRFHREIERLFTAIGFAIGASAAARESKRLQAMLAPTVTKQYTIATPEPTEQQSHALEELARQVKWNKPGGLEDVLELAKRGKVTRNRARFVSYVAHLIRSELFSKNVPESKTNRPASPTRTPDKNSAYASSETLKAGENA